RRTTELRAAALASGQRHRRCGARAVVDLPGERDLVGNRLLDVRPEVLAHLGHHRRHHESDSHLWLDSEHDPGGAHRSHSGLLDCPMGPALGAWHPPSRGEPAQPQDHRCGGKDPSGVGRARAHHRGALFWTLGSPVGGACHVDRAERVQSLSVRIHARAASGQPSAAGGREQRDEVCVSSTTPAPPRVLGGGGRNACRQLGGGAIAGTWRKEPEGYAEPATRPVNRAARKRWRLSRSPLSTAPRISRIHWVESRSRAWPSDWGSSYWLFGSWAC